MAELFGTTTRLGTFTSQVMYGMRQPQLRQIWHGRGLTFARAAGQL